MPHDKTFEQSLSSTSVPRNRFVLQTTTGRQEVPPGGSTWWFPRLFVSTTRTFPKSYQIERPREMDVEGLTISHGQEAAEIGSYVVQEPSSRFHERLFSVTSLGNVFFGESVTGYRLPWKKMCTPRVMICLSSTWSPTTKLHTVPVTLLR